jgi:hypothetical protein
VSVEALGGLVMGEGGHLVFLRWGRVGGFNVFANDTAAPALSR